MSETAMKRLSIAVVLAVLFLGCLQRPQGISPSEVIDVITRGTLEQKQGLQKLIISDLSINKDAVPECEVVAWNLDNQKNTESIVICRYVTQRERPLYAVGDCERFFVLAFKKHHDGWTFLGGIDSVGFDTGYRKDIEIGFPALLSQDSRVISMTHYYSWPKGHHKVFTIYRYDPKYQYVFKKIFQRVFPGETRNVSGLVEFKGPGFPRKIRDKSKGTTYVWSESERAYTEE